MKRAITNLVINAARFGEQIVIRAATERGWLRIEVDDDGPGIPTDERENVFRPFYRLDHARNQDEGNSGLGLAIARDIAKSHGGDVTLAKARWAACAPSSACPFNCPLPRVAIPRRSDFQSNASCAKKAMNDC